MATSRVLGPRAPTARPETQDKLGFPPAIATVGITVVVIGHLARHIRHAKCKRAQQMPSKSLLKLMWAMLCSMDAIRRL
jgi:hypothetical protein